MPHRTAFLAALAFTATAFAQDETPLEKCLKQPLLEQRTVQQEVEDYVERKVPPVPEAKTTQEWEKHARRMRQETLDKVVFRGEAAKWRNIATQAEWLGDLEGGPGYRLKKVRFEAVPGMWIPAILYEPENLKGKVPVMLAVNGHDSKGKAAEYKQMRCINLAKRGMLVLNLEWVGMGQLRTPGFAHLKMNQLDLCGTSGLAPFYLSMSRGLDILVQHPHADVNRVAVSGLSGGGWQTIFISALDERVTLSNPVAGYSSFKTRVRNHADLGDSEQTPVDLATTADYAQLTAMRAPRPTLLTFNAKDNCCFATPHAMPPLLAAARPIFHLYGEADALRTHSNEVPGDHNFGIENREALYKMVGDFFFTDAKDFDPKEIPSKSEVKTGEQLQVPLPEVNESFHSLALKLAESLPKPSTGSFDDRRKLLREIVKAQDLKVTAAQAVEIAGAADTKLTVRGWRLKLDSVWTVPVVEITSEQPRGVSIVVADAGRVAVAKDIAALAASGQRVLAFDPFYFGESKVPQKNWLFALMLSTVGDRPIGLQASQINSVANWAKSEFKADSLQLVSIGPRLGLAAHIAAALDPQTISKLDQREPLKSLKDVIAQDRSVSETPELLCFGLLEHFDIPQLDALTLKAK